MTSNKTVTANFLLPPAQLMAYSPQTVRSMRTNGFRLLLSGATNFPYAIERTTNLSTWTAFLTNSVSSTQFTEIRDTTASNAEARFYRPRRVQ